MLPHQWLLSSVLSIIPPHSTPTPQNPSSCPNSPWTHNHHDHHNHLGAVPINRELQIQSQFFITKRTLNISIVTLVLSSLGQVEGLIGAEGNDDDYDDGFRRYTDLGQGFTLLVPSSYVKVDKAGATALFEEVNKGTNNVGVVVSPVRLTSLRDFGSPEFVVDKLIQAEKRKESTRDVELIAAAERPGKPECPVYEFEYKIDSNRGGIKRIFSAAFVSSKKLYLLNIAHADKPETPLDNHTRFILEQVMHSFDLISST